MEPGRSTPLEASNGARRARSGWIDDRRDWLACLVLALATLAAYGPVGSAGFINLDDPQYVFDNPHVATGLRWENVAWAFTSPHVANWHPLTGLSHMLDCQLFGLDAGAHHWVNLVLHIANALLLFLVLRAMTGRFWPSGFVAALFALHPLHVESVAWISERKDVLSTLFWLLTTAAYVRYVRQRGVGAYGLALALFALGLMAKPMLVTLPFVLLLLDYWPLRRLGAASMSEAGQAVPQRETARRLLSEKVPFFALSLASIVMTLIFQRSSDAVVPLTAMPIATRLANAAISYVTYLVQTFWPFELAVYYPLPRVTDLGRAFGAALLLVGVSAGVLRAARRRPYLTVGWLWYLGTLVPVIGLVQVGGHAMADRYTYVPLIGVFIMLAWGIPETLGKRRHGRAVIAVLSLGTLLILGAASRRQVGYWTDSERLFRHALEVTTENARAHYSLGLALAASGRTGEALDQYRETLRIERAYPAAHYQLGVLFEREGRIEEAKREYQRELKKFPGNGYAHNNLGVMLSRLGDHDASVHHLRQALRLLPDQELVRDNLDRVLAGQTL
jgi:hypothetical protein